MVIRLTLLAILIAFPFTLKGQGATQPYHLTDREVARLLARVDNKSEGFRKALKDSLKKATHEQKQDVDEVQTKLKSFDRETRLLNDHFKHHKSGSDDVRAVLLAAGDIESFMSAHSLDRITKAAWETLRSDLDLLARAYDVRWQWNSPRSD